ncbi:MAG: phospho-sugar mutase [Pyramidobacter sp.]
MTWRERYEQWLHAPWIDEKSRSELARLTDEKDIEDRFYRNLAFGTAGMRGVMGAGTNRMNVFIVRRATFGLANYLKKEFPDDCRKGVVIAYDTRNRSAEFAQETARVLCACGVPAKIFGQPEPVPVLSFAVRALKAVAGVVITASHNPKEYNGYKVYDAEGCQLVPALADKLTACVESVDDFESIPLTGGDELLTRLDQDVLEKYLDAVQQSSIPQSNASELKIVYTPLHGSGNVPVRAILDRCGFTDVTVVPEQELPDGDFPTVPVPNPENRAALQMGIELAEKIGAHVVIGTDPDSDRIGCAVKAGREYRLLSGNQIGALLADFVLSHREVTPRSTVITTVVTGELGARVAESHGATVTRTLTGFKYIGEKMTRFQRTGEAQFVMGYEESYGYLVGTHARDKDAVVAAMLICQMAAEAKAAGQTLCDRLEGLYAKLGYYLDWQDSFTLKGKDGAAQIAAKMTWLREHGAAFDGISKVLDYSTGIDGLPKENVMKFLCADGSWFAVRPSGTEPKIKIYYCIKGETRRKAEDQLDARRQSVETALELRR